MKAGWIFVKNNGNNEPDLPAAVGGSFTNPMENHTIDGGPVGFEHTHLLVGGLAQKSVERVGEADALHTHLVVPLPNGTYFQKTLDATSHTHDLNLLNGVLSPQWYLLFWYGSDADAALIVASSNCHVAVEAVVVQDEDGYDISELDNTAWTAGQRAWWVTAVADVLGYELPTEVTNGKLLMVLFSGALVGRPGQPESALRPVRI